LERFHHQSDVALFEVSDPAMYELGAPAGSPFAEIVLFEGGDVGAAARGIDGEAAAGGPAADDHDVPGSVPRVEAREHVLAAHVTDRARSSSSSGSTLRAIRRGVRPPRTEAWPARIACRRASAAPAPRSNPRTRP